MNGKHEYYTKYDAYAAEGFYHLNRELSVKGYKLVRVRKFIEFAVDMIMNHKWLPDAVCGYAWIRGFFTKDEMISTNTLYRYIDQALINLTNFDLLEKHTRRTSKQTVKANKRIYGDSITERPDWINNRSQFGHWEIDTVIGVKDKNEPVLLTLTNRHTRYEPILKIEDKIDMQLKKHPNHS